MQKIKIIIFNCKFFSQFKFSNEVDDKNFDDMPDEKYKMNAFSAISPDDIDDFIPNKIFD